MRGIASPPRRGLRAAGTAGVGIDWLGEPAHPVRLACIALVVAGIARLQRHESAG